MNFETLQALKDKGLLNNDQFQKIELIVNRKIVSVFYELRTLLYLGVLLFTTGVGFLVYQNIGELGHIIAILLLSLLTILCFAYAFIKSAPFSFQKGEAPNPYFDYVVLLGCLLFVSIFGYLQFQFGFLEQHARITFLITSILFFFFAYRFDHLGVLSLAITALTSFFGIVVSLNNFDLVDQLQNVGLILSVGLAAISLIVEWKGIKEHFTFTYLNFCALIFFSSALAGIFDSPQGDGIVYYLALYAGVALAILLANWKKSFIFLLYAVVAGYIGTTYWLSDNTNWELEMWLFYLIASCGGFIFFMRRFRNYFKRTE